MLLLDLIFYILAKIRRMWPISFVKICVYSANGDLIYGKFNTSPIFSRIFFDNLNAISAKFADCVIILHYKFMGSKRKLLILPQIFDIKLSKISITDELLQYSFDNVWPKLAKFQSYYIDSRGQKTYFDNDWPDKLRIFAE